VTKVDPDSSLERFLGLLEGHNSNLKDLLLAKTEQDFIGATEGAIERAMKTIENGSKEYATLNEPGLSHLLADCLNLMGWRATAETNNNGHVDVVVECAFGRHWKYLGECKLHKGYQYHVDGCEQLLGYCTGREPRAFCMDFINATDDAREATRVLGHLVRVAHDVLDERAAVLLPPTGRADRERPQHGGVAVLVEKAAFLTALAPPDPPFWAAARCFSRRASGTR
jgi:hypothetical protein